MEKVYLLLRNNVQTGPFTLQQLQNQILKPTDLVWVEGKSMCWRYVSEIEELYPEAQTNKKNEVNPTQSFFIKEKKKRQSKKNEHLVSARATNPLSQEESLKRWAEAIRRRAETYASTHPNRSYSRPAPQETNPYRYYSDENPIELVVHKQEAKTVGGLQLLLVATATTILAASWYGKITIIPKKVYPAHTSVAAAPSLFHIEPKKERQPEAGNQEEPVALINIEAPSVDETSTTSVKTQAQVTKEKKDIELNEEIPVATLSKPSILQAPVKKEEEIVNEATLILPKQETNAVQPIDIVNTEEAHAKKKTLGQALKGLFKKKKKDKEDEDIAQEVQ